MSNRRIYQQTDGRRRIQRLSALVLTCRPISTKKTKNLPFFDFKLDMVRCNKLTEHLG
jgi:hypothetical protein